MSRFAALFANQRGAVAAEFALVLPVALLFLLGTIDVGRYFWALNQLEKAVQAGTRYAVATDVVARSLDATNYTNFACPGGNLKAGAQICQQALGVITCVKPTTAVTCSCAQSALGSASCPSNMGSVNSTAFDKIVHRMQVIDSGIKPAFVRVKYSGSGIGFAGDPYVDDAGNALSQVSPLVTVEVTSFSFRSISLLGYGIRLPGFRYTQTLEDGDGAIAY